MDKGKIILRYPPDYDGELHINFEKKRGAVEVNFTVALQPGESIGKALYRVGEDLVSQLADAK